MDTSTLDVKRSIRRVMRGKQMARLLKDKRNGEREEEALAHVSN